MTVAPPILTGTPGSFAHGVFHHRHPKLIEQVLAAHPYGSNEQAALHQLLDESTHGVIDHLPESAADWEQWSDWGRGIWGRTWADTPFLWAESFFYKRLLEAVGYFRAGVWHGIDPFEPTKTAELSSTTVSDELAALDDLPRLDEENRRNSLLLSALWGNQADLGFRLTTETRHRSSKLLVDDSAALWTLMDNAAAATVCVIADNAGRELLPDLVLVDYLLTNQLAEHVVLYVKPHPYYVSDATMTDVLAALRRLRAASEVQAHTIGLRLWQALSKDRLIVRTHKFFCAPLPFHAMPDDLRAELATATITILKGDLNYRRLVGDRKWAPTTSFRDLVDYFPSPAAVLRALKSDVIVGLASEDVEALDGTDIGWRTNGEHAVIQLDQRLQ
ncbi:damage-control phosphatase ARMT1 family protein [Nocardia sp. NPDC049707]|uniref:damage-control phosphatase ARMT1 family protein n=1 Tax=Nocardia sp. NPDC049707 TaxID=3154735 RepID=UPI0034186E4C